MNKMVSLIVLVLMASVFLAATPPAGGFTVTTSAPGADTTVTVSITGTTATSVTVVTVGGTPKIKGTDWWVVGNLPNGSFVIEFAVAPTAGDEVIIKGGTSGNHSGGYGGTAQW